MEIYFSFVVPVYNRPGEIRELLESLSAQTYSQPFEVVIVEDGSSISSAEVIRDFSDRLELTYFKKRNTGPGDSRNFGMKRARGTYCILVDSDCILPPQYLEQVAGFLSENYLDCYGGADDAHPSFNAMQQAISFTMTSFLTTGGIRGKEATRKKFQPRSFNMGLSRKAFEASGGFGNIHPGEDPDLSLRLKKLGFSIGFIPGASVYHKRRINFKSFFRQVHKFGLTRPILNRWHPGSAQITYWFPTFFLLGLLFAVSLPFLIRSPLGWSLLGLYAFYLMLVAIGAGLKSKNPGAAILAPVALVVQYLGYGLGFLKSTILLTFSKKKPEALMPELFFKP
ncbi:glycosyltransferase [Robiginitalea aurantiaca]|uniref:Glycosyltransferase n=1 Tax=Robiginitalea aurantiaca TaxID=3056915 RepID=A0ABT7WGK0_9FLAO|nr:glycosyltransferase [Robiginitalea aurantiaca]MDM9631944.1 glycosyltransferase [Robiginitalea aurantiaca]